MFGFISRGDKVIWPPSRDSSADVSSPSSCRRNTDEIIIANSGLRASF